MCWVASDCTATVPMGPGYNLPIIRQHKSLAWSYPDFSGWSNPATSTCGSQGMMGSFGTGASTELTLSVLAAGTYQIQFDFFHIDSWDSGELGRLWWNGAVVWSRQYTWQSGSAGTQVCGGYYGDSVGMAFSTVTIQVVHVGGNAVLKFDSTLNSATTDESWGVDNIQLTGSAHTASLYMHTCWCAPSSCSCA